MKLAGIAGSPIRKTITLKEILRRPEIRFRDLVFFAPALREFNPEVKKQVEIIVKYEGFLSRQETDIARLKRLDEAAIPPGLDYLMVSGLKTEVREKLARFQPFNLGQASRIPGITPAAISILMIYLKKHC